MRTLGRKASSLVACRRETLAFALRLNLLDAIVAGKIELNQLLFVRKFKVQADSSPLGRAPGKREDRRLGGRGGENASGAFIPSKGGKSRRDPVATAPLRWRFSPVLGREVRA